MYSPPHTRHASASTVLPAEPQYWKENLPAGHGYYKSHSFLIYPLGFTWSGYITTPMVSNDARMD